MFIHNLIDGRISRIKYNYYLEDILNCGYDMWTLQFIEFGGVEYLFNLLFNKIKTINSTLQYYSFTLLCRVLLLLKYRFYIIY